MENQQEVSTTGFRKVIPLIVVIAAGVALCAVMKNFVCGKAGESCQC
jgi:hypothetical protein